MSESKKPFSLLKKEIKPKQQRSHVRSKPTLLHKYKSKFHQTQSFSWETRAETQYFCAIDLDSMPKVLLAYHQVSSKKNSIKPDNVASTHKASPPPEQPPETAVAAPSSPAKQQVYEDDEKYCICERPYSDGELMFKCEGFCINWYHPQCIGLQSNEIERQKNSKERWYCPTCCERAMGIANTQMPNKKK